MIINLMNKIVYFYWCSIFFSCILKNVFSEGPIPVHLTYKGKYTSDIRNYEIVVPQRVSKDGNFISHFVSHQHSKRSTTELEFIFYKIPIEGKDYLIELTPNKKLISPGAVVEIHKEDVNKSVEGKFFNESSKNEKISKMFRNLNIRKLENTECHFSGHVKGENISKAALSTCYGLAGFIQIPKGFYTIEPVAEHNPFVEGAYPHILYKEDGLENSSVCHTMGELASSLTEQIVRKRRESNYGLSLPMYIETLVVLDKTLINHHRGSDCENYVLTVFNMAFNLFHDASLGLMMTLTIVRIIRLEVENDEMNLRVNADAEKTLRYFQNWQYEINPGDDSHPNHHDIAVLITRVNVCYSPSNCGLLGLTTIGKACDPKLSAALCEDNGLRLGYIIAHEIGHLLGADHDSVNSSCNGTDADGLKTVMHPQVSMTTQKWSSCSQAYFKTFFGSGMGSCLLDEPEEHHFNVQDLQPGVMYNADFQCKHLITMSSRECDMGSTCDSLNCYVPEYACIITHTPPADGTHCGENMWCHDTKCLVVGERPGAIDGNWGEWSAWSDCSRTCGSGVASSVRNCDKPQPSHGGKNCVGERKRYKICASMITTVPQNISDLIRFISEEVNVSFVGKPCETGRPSFRDIQCGEFNDWIYPEDGKIHTWKAYYFHNDNPCSLYCINEEKQVAALRPRVVDGTMCYRGIRDICVAGTCKSLPCDLYFESNAIEDACGVCHGDGTGCDFSEGIETFSKLTKGLTKLVNIPSGTRNIKIEEMSPSTAKIVVRDRDTKDIYVRGKSLGMFSVPGSQAWLGMIRKNQEALNIPGPITKPLSIWIQRSDNVTVKWSMALPAEQQRKPEFTWDFLKWGPCSAKCGPGTQKSEPSCIEEKAGLVEDSYCSDLEMPPSKVRRCEIIKCEPRWMVGDWKGCEQPAANKKERKRVVYCIKSIGEGEGESQIVSDSDCTDPKPHESEPCENRQKREDSEYSGYSFFQPGSMFKSDSAEFGFHKKYEDYLKHFAAVSVPQRNSETIPLYLVSSPHFKHYFHVLETPEDSDDDSTSNENVNLANGTSYDTQVQNKASPDFYKETFSGQQIGVSHVQSIAQESVSNLENRTKKSLKWDSTQIQNTNIPELNLRKICREANNLRVRKKFREHRNPSLKRHRSLIFNVFSKKKPVHNWTDLRNLMENLRGNTFKNHDLVNNSKPGTISSLERGKLKSYQWNAYTPKSLTHRLSSFLSLLSKTKVEVNKDHGTPVDTLKKLTTHSEFDGSGVKKLPLTKENLLGKIKSFEIQKLMEERNTFFKTFNPLSSGRFDFPTKRGFRENHVALEDLLSEKKSKRYQRNQKRMRILSSYKKPNLSRVHKRKRSSRKWKKPKPKDFSTKSGKEQIGNLGGTETRNYLNNLFRDNHPKIFTNKPNLPNKPQESKIQIKKPVIKEGVLVIDKDLSENQMMEIAFEDYKGEDKRRKYITLPHPSKNGKKLLLKGQDVFNFLQELQRRSAREAFYRTNSENRESVESTTKTANGNPEPPVTAKILKSNETSITIDLGNISKAENKTQQPNTTTGGSVAISTHLPSSKSDYDLLTTTQSTTIKIQTTTTTIVTTTTQQTTTQVTTTAQSTVSTQQATSSQPPTTTQQVILTQPTTTTQQIMTQPSTTTQQIILTQPSTTTQQIILTQPSTTTQQIILTQPSTTTQQIILSKPITTITPQAVTTTQTTTTTESTDDSSDGCEYDIDEPVLESPKTTTESTKEKKKKKKKKNKKKDKIVEKAIIEKENETER